jgi:hypothetical protein
MLALASPQFTNMKHVLVHETVISFFVLYLLRIGNVCI